MNKEEFLKRYGEQSYTKLLKQGSAWKVANPERALESVKKAGRKRHRKGGKYYNKTYVYRTTGLQGERHKIRTKHGKLWLKYKNTIAPDSQIHHEWVPNTPEYTGLALVEADQHMHGFIEVIEILEGEITLFTEEKIRTQ